ncbi:MAG: CBS domain-containing protein, partial [Planctomycetota bacterium]
MRVAEIMQKDVATCGPDEMLDAILSRMRERRIRHMPVVTESGALVGVLADRDIRNVSFASRRHSESLGHLVVLSIPAQDVMAPEPVTTTPDESVKDALQKMKERNVGCLPVMESGKLVGIVSTVDLLRLLETF